MSEQISNEAVMDEKPLVTFALFSYNQEKYIREAVEGALAQTYSPLQIIISDDCSPDRTFEIMEEMVATYIGPHEILLNRNKKNIGLADHINHVMKLTKGEFVVVAAGDDVSLPERTSKLFAFFIQNNRPAVIFSDCEEINVNGATWLGAPTRPIEQTYTEFLKNPRVWGATHAWCKQIVDKFPELNKSVSNEDLVFPVRAYILGRSPKMLNEKLIKYRRDVRKIKGSSDLIARFFWQIWPSYSASKQILEDIEYVQEVEYGLYREVVCYAERQKVVINVIKAYGAVDFVKKSWQCLRVFGVKKIIKLWSIRYGRVGLRERLLLDVFVK